MCQVNYCPIYSRGSPERTTRLCGRLRGFSSTTSLKRCQKLRQCLFSVQEIKPWSWCVVIILRETETIVPFRPTPTPLRHSLDVQHVLLAALDGLYSTAYRLTGRTDIAEDLVQETARKAVQAATSLRDHRNVRAWIFKILMNGIRDQLRRKRLWQEVDLEAVDADFVATARSTAMDDVPGAVAELAPPLRALVLLIDIEEFTIGEAAVILGIPPGTAASRLARAHRELRETLSSYRKSAEGGGG